MQIIEEHTLDLFKRIFNKLRPPENITVSEWADKYRRLPAESSAEPGQWKTEKTPYLKRIMDMVTDEKVRKIVIMSSVQIGKSEILINIMGFYAHINPSPVLVVQPTVDMGINFSKERIAPSIRDTPVLRKAIGIEKSRDSKNTILKKYFPGGYIAIVGANSPVGLASRPIKILLADEIDRWPESAKKEGDPLTIAEKRTTTYPNTHKMIYVSTPTIDGISRIQHEFNQGTMEKWKFPCPSCKKYLEIKWGNIILPKDEDGEIDLNQEIKCACPSCGELNNEIAWKSGKGMWVPTAENGEVKSFNISALASPWKSWKAIAEDFLAAKNDIEMYKVWTNTEMGEVWIEDGESIDESELLKRREYYHVEVPNDVLVITAGVDVQDDRFEMEVVGWGERHQSWGIEYKVIHGNTSLPETWERLDQHLKKVYACEDGTKLPITRTCIDSGGHRTTECYTFCKPRESRGVFAIKGKGGVGIHIVHGMTKTKKAKNNLIIIAVDVAKARLFSWLALSDEKKTGYCHFPHDEDDFQRNYDEKYFNGLTSEIKTVKLIKGRPKTEWILKKGARNEPLDCRVYNIAAIEILNPNFFDLKRQKGNKPVKRKRRRGTTGEGVRID